LSTNLLSVDDGARGLRGVVVVLRGLFVGLQQLLVGRRGRGSLGQGRRLQILDVDFQRVDQGFEIFGGTVTERGA
jgi:hypothetical protein